MRLNLALLSSLFLLLAGSCSDEITNGIAVSNLKCEYMNKAVISEQSPRLSWELISKLNGQEQTAWQVIVSDNTEEIEAGKGNVWDSGKQKGNETFGIKLKGKRLNSFTKYYWKVRVWDQDGKITGWSETADFITGAFDKKEWIASWIGDRPEPPLEYPLVYKHIGYLSSYTDRDKEEKWVQVDLGKTVDFNKILLFPSYNNIKNLKDYYFPLAYRIEVSKDGDKWEKCAEKNPASSPDGKAAEITFNKIQARYVRFTATKLQRYNDRIFDYEDQGDPAKMFALSLAELEVLNDDKLLSVGSAVTCKDALIKIDREDGYDPDMLTDGITDTPDYPEKRATPPSPLLRKTIELKDKPVKAIAFVSALGLYEIAFNGRSPDQRVLAPEWTDYHKRVQYQAFDVSNLLDAGTNVIGAQLADGWYAGMLGPTRWSNYFPKRGAYGLNRRLFLQMEVQYPNGENETFISDDSWKIYPDGPIRMADNFLGETYDANKEVAGWLTKSFDDSSWQRAVEDQQADINLVPQNNQPVRIIETLDAKSVSKTKDGCFLFDVGENIAGWCNIQLEGKPDDKIVLRHGEILDDKGQLYTENLGAAVQRDTVILGPSGKLKYEPRFTYHGFRFVEVRGLRTIPDKSILKAKVIASDQPRTGYFECSNPMLNQLYKNINRSHVSNMIGVPTDCPQRDERCGWMGDVFIFAQTSMFNRDMAAFFNKWMVDIMDAQSKRGTFPDIAPHPFAYEKHFTNAPGWADAAVKLPFLMYINYGGKEIIEDHFEAYERYIENIRKSNPDLIWKSGLGLNYGDWLNGNTLNAEGFPKTGAQIPSEAFSTIMFYNSVNILSKMADAIGRNEKALYYSDLAANIKDAFINRFVDADGKIEGDAQACYALALHYGVYTKELEKNFEKRMIDKFIPYSGRMNTGFHSTLCLMKELVKRRYTEKAYQLLETKEFPSWGYSIEQGATSIWERWDGYVKGRGFQGAGMNSFNHYAFGAIGEWMYENILGIQPDNDSPGFKHFILKPLPGGTLTWAKGSFNSISGKIDASWKRENNRFEYDFTVPPNTTATVYIPGKSAGSVLLDGKKLSDLNKDIFKGYTDGYAVFEIRPGTFSATSELQ
ncbi:MAG: family 78 glycoside hydrolase catalytic domain [Bacteroidales bacterium]|nr:family 78 glycoside hydrolase catalytic domain [Bacteroidales bacterium]